MKEQNFIFISSSSKDAEITSQITKVLESNEILCKMAPQNATDGEASGEDVTDCIDKSLLVLFVCSENSNQSCAVEKELAYAYNEGKVIIPFKIDEAEASDQLKNYLANTLWVSGCPFDDEHLDKLVGLLKELLLGIDDEEEQEEHYDLLFNSNTGEVLLLIGSRTSEPENPRFVYDGGDTMILYRNMDSAVTINNIAEDAQPILNQAEEILIRELSGDDCLFEYKAPIRRVKSLKAFL